VTESTLPMKEHDSVVAFYDQLAPDFHLIFPNWERAIQNQGELLKSLISSHVKTANPSVLDCSCGIGTQSLGLAMQGYRVTATDISPEAIRRAEREARERRLPVEFAVADFRELGSQVGGTFDAVISFDNALPHLLTNSDMKKVVWSIHSKLSPGGLFLASIRDYDAAIKDKPKTTPPNEFSDNGLRRIVFQMWDWGADSTYVLHQFILKDETGKWTIEHQETVYRAWQRDELTELLRLEGFREIRWLMPQETRFYQPIVAARKSAETD